MRRISAELQPSQAVVQRMQAMQIDLQRAHQHLRRERRGHGAPSDRWGLEQAAAAPQDEDWLITYLDMVTLLMVAMIVMLAFAGPVSKQIQAARHETAAAMTSPDDTLPARPHTAAVLSPEPAAEPASSSAAAPDEALEPSPPPSAPTLAPLAGTFPEPIPAAPQEAKDMNASSSRTDGARIAGMRSWAVPLEAPRAVDAASVQPDPPAMATPPETPPPQTAPVVPPAARAAEPAPSEGEAVAASLPLAELGKDVEVIINKRSVSFRVNSEILFDTGETDLSREGLAVLKRMAQVLVKAGYDITVEGHTDSVRMRSSSPYPSNWELSSARAGSVVRYLQANGIPKSRLKAVGFADSRPIADNGTAEGRARNRRVELVVSKHSDE